MMMMFKGIPDVIDYGKEILYDKISLDLVNNLIVYFQRHDRNLTDICVAEKYIKLLVKELKDYHDSEALFMFTEEGNLMKGQLWSINFHGLDQPIIGGRDGEEEYYPSGDNKIYAYDWTDTSDPWLVEVKLGEEKCEAQ
jgi:hypothetical protein